MSLAMRTTSATASEFSFHVFPKMSCYASRAQQFSQIVEKKLGQELKSYADRCVHAAQKGETHIVADAPFGMFGHRHDHLFGRACARKHAQHLGLVQERIYEHHREDIAMAFRQQRPSNTGRPPARKFEFVAGRELGGALDQEFLRDETDLRGRGRAHANTHKVEYKKLV